MDVNGTRDAVRRARTAEREMYPGKRYALVIGIDEYKKPFNPLRNAVNDANAISDKLRDEFGFEVEQFNDGAANRAEILDVLNQWKNSTDSEDSLLLFFAGHGDNRPDEHHGLKGYIIPFDSTSDPRTWIAESEIVQAAREIPARHILLIFDACYAGTTFRDDIPPGAREDQILKALVAGTEDEPVLDGGAGDHSIFTRAVLDGLDGFADSGQRPDDVITADELITYVRSEISWRSQLRNHPQTAVGGSLQGNRTGDDFQFKPTKPRLKAPILRNLSSPEFQDRIAAAEQMGLPVRESAEVTHLKATNLKLLLLNDENREVRMMAAKSLGTLGHPEGVEVLAEELDSGEDTEVQKSAAISLGKLARSITDSGKEEYVKDADQAVETLIKTLKMEDAALRRSAKEGLSYVPEYAQKIKEVIQRDDSENERDVLDTLAFLADRHPALDMAWPSLDRVGHRFRRRFYLTRLRLERLWPGILRPIFSVGLGGAIGLALAYLLVVLFTLSPLSLYGPATLTFVLWPGAFVGAGIALIPRLIRGLFRSPGALAIYLAALLSGMYLAFWMVLPNWFLGIGKGFTDWLLPGLISGPLIALALSLLPLEPWETSQSKSEKTDLKQFFRRLQKHAFQILLIIGTSALTFALGRISERLNIGVIDPWWWEVVLWGFGGAILGGALSIGWLAWPISTPYDQPT
jgi:uncharacterized caspase-like protein